ncbi:MAG: acetate--CoA ligase family protein [Bacteroidales bacterium]|nr:acetate--CoA ligase family protein [Bacteroidales bacterium]
MISNQLVNPQSIVVIGASNDVSKPGGKVLKNLLDHGFKGQLYVVNPKEEVVQGVKSYKDVSDLPQTDLAILAIAARHCPSTVEVLAHSKKTRGFIILSAGFHEESEEGARLEKQIVDIIENTGGSLIGPNCVGMLNHHYAGAFTTPIPVMHPKGVDFISGSGATAVFIMEASIPKGLKFSSVWSVGNSAQLGVEDVLEYLDNTYDPETSSQVKLLYIESVNKPGKLLRHASSLIRKGCRIAAIKAGSSEAGSRAASSHTGALASSDAAVEALFNKAGIVRCSSREELATVASVFMHPRPAGKRIAVITHAGGPAVMLTDALSENGLQVPAITGTKADELLTKLFPGSSIANPIDFLATGTAEQLGHIIDACETDFEDIDAMAVIFGSPGLFEVYDVYKLLDEKMKSCRKPIYPVLPSIINVAKEIEYFISLGRINFPDEVLFGRALAKVIHTPAPEPENIKLPKVDVKVIRDIIHDSENGYLSPEKVQAMLDAAGIVRAGEAIVTTADAAVVAARNLGYPIVMKVVGPVHKSDVGGVVLNVKDDDTVIREFNRMIQIKDTTAIMLQPMLSGTQIFTGASCEPKFGHMILAGLGGIFIEVLKDVNSAISPVSKEMAIKMIQGLKSYGIIKGVRGQEGVNEEMFAETICRLSALVEAAPEIKELDLNPLLGTPTRVVAVDARIRIEK